MIRFERTSRSYGNRVAVCDLDLAIPRGELFALLGHNGAGKTTTIKMLVGLLHATSGTVVVGDHDVRHHARETSRLIGYVPDQPFLYEKLTGREFLLFTAQMYGLSPREAATDVEREIERFELTDFVDDLTESYSHGMKQRTVFAAAMVHSPAILVVDEPLVGLDPHSIRLVKDLLRSCADRGMSVFMSTHTLVVAEEIADRIGIMSSGNLIFVGTLAELRERVEIDDGSLETLYLALLEQSSTTAPPRVGSTELPTAEATEVYRTRTE